MTLYIDVIYIFTLNDINIIININENNTWIVRLFTEIISLMKVVNNIDRVRKILRTYTTYSKINTKCENIHIADI